MENRLSKILLLLILLFFIPNSYLSAQGMARSTGLGLRVGFWNITGHPTRISASDYGNKATVDVGGVSTWLYFFSRAKDNWFLEFSLGGVGGVHSETSTYQVESAEFSGIVPFLFGLRYDLFSTRLPSSLQPYLTGGAGPYWISSVKTNDLLTGGEASVQSNIKYGAYLGGGMNLLLASWIALNFDWKYHFVDFRFEEQYSGLEFGLGFSFMWGKKQEFFQVKEIKSIVQDIYPAYYQFYNTYPLALVSIKNTAGYPIEVNVRSNIEHYSVRPKESGFERIERGKTVDIPVTAIFGNRLLTIVNRKPAVLDIEIEARAGRTVKKEVSAQIILHNKNAWNGEMDKLSFFVTPDDEDVLKLSRKLMKDAMDTTPGELDNFNKARIIFDELGKAGIQYHRDPNILFYRDDRVQYAMETLNLGSGDCDDLVVLYASLLESQGINTAFVEVQDPQKEIAHVYLLFDSGLESSQGQFISSNEKRFVIRTNSKDQSIIWIPVETTLIGSGFEEAWKTAAVAYLEEGVLRHGMAAGWVKIIDVD